MPRKKATEEIVPEVTETVIEDTVVNDPVVDVVEEVPTVDDGKVEAETSVIEPTTVEEKSEPEEVPVKKTRAKKTKESTKAKDAEVAKVAESQPTVVEKADAKTVPFKGVIAAEYAIFSTTGPGLQYNRAGMVPAGTAVTVLEVSGNWGRIGNKKWVSLNYILNT